MAVFSCYFRGKHDRFQMTFTAFNLTGRAFNPSLNKYLDEFGLREPFKDDNFTVSANWTPVFVTAATSDHFMEMRGALNSMWSRYPNATFVVYDIGLDPEQVCLMNTPIQRCGSRLQRLRNGVTWSTRSFPSTSTQRTFGSERSTRGNSS